VQHGLFILGALVTCSAFCAAAVRFGREHKLAERSAYAAALQARDADDAMSPSPAKA
jgi:hypothetical protein